MRINRVYIFVAGILIVLGVIAYAGYRIANNSPGVISVYAHVTRGNLVEAVQLTGEVVSSSSQTFTAPAASSVAGIYVQVGQTVQQGQLLVQLSSPQLQTSFLNAQAQLSKDTSLLNEYESPAYRNVLQAEVNADSAQVQSDEQNVTNIENEISELAIDAPIGGQVTIEAQQGQYVQGGTILAEITPSSGPTRQVIAPYPGSVQDIYVSNGQTVSQGQLIIQMQSTQLESQLALAQASVARDQSNLSQAEINVQQLPQLIAQQQFVVNADQQTVNELQSEINNLSIKAPFAGVVTAVDVVNGQQVNSNSQILTLAGNSYTVTVPVDQADLDGIHVGQTATITVSTYPNRTYSGKVIQVSAVGTYSNGASTFPVTVSIENPSGLANGMSANVSIVTNTINDALLVPLAALHDNGHIVYKKGKGSSNEPVAVKVLGENTLFAAVSSFALVPGDQILLATSKPSAVTTQNRARLFNFGGRGFLRGTNGRSGSHSKP